MCDESGTVKRMTEEQAEQFVDYILCDDMDVYENEIMFLPIEEQIKFLNDNPHFLEGMPFTRDEEGVLMLRQNSFRSTLRRIKKMQDESVSEK